MMKKIPVNDKRSLSRDERSNAIINTDREAYNSYKRLRERKLKEMKDFDSIKNDIDNMKSEINEIKSLLRKLVGSK